MRKFEGNNVTPSRTDRALGNVSTFDPRGPEPSVAEVEPYFAWPKPIIPRNIKVKSDSDRLYRSMTFPEEKTRRGVEDCPRPTINIW